MGMNSLCFCESLLCKQKLLKTDCTVDLMRQARKNLSVLAFSIGESVEASEMISHPRDIVFK